jgi:hypothetical protein
MGKINTGCPQKPAIWFGEEVGSQKSEVRSRENEVGSLKTLRCSWPVVFVFRLSNFKEFSQSFLNTGNKKFDEDKENDDNDDNQDNPYKNAYLRLRNTANFKQSTQLLHLFFS